MIVQFEYQKVAGLKLGMNMMKTMDVTPNECLEPGSRETTNKENNVFTVN